MINRQNLNEIFLREVQKTLLVEIREKYKWWNILTAIVFLVITLHNFTWLSGILLFLMVTIALYDTKQFISIERNVGINKLFEATVGDHTVKVAARDKMEVMIIMADQNKQVTMEDIKEIDYVIV